MDSPTVFHVAAQALPTGEVLRPYAVGTEYPVLVRRAAQEIDAGQDAIRRLLAGEEWRRLVRLGGYRFEMVLLEAAFERARVRAAPHLPSRLDAVYVWPSLELALRFHTGYRPTGFIHRCALVDGTTLERDGALIVEAFESAHLSHPTEHDLCQIDDRAIRYWRAQTPMTLPELLVHGTVVVEAIIDT